MYQDRGQIYLQGLRVRAGWLVILRSRATKNLLAAMAFQSNNEILRSCWSLRMTFRLECGFSRKQGYYNKKREVSR